MVTRSADVTSRLQSGLKSRLPDEANHPDSPPLRPLSQAIKEGRTLQSFPFHYPLSPLQAASALRPRHRSVPRALRPPFPSSFADSRPLCGSPYDAIMPPLRALRNGRHVSITDGSSQEPVEFAGLQRQGCKAEDAIPPMGSLQVDLPFGLEGLWGDRCLSLVPHGWAVAILTSNQDVPPLMTRLRRPNIASKVDSCLGLVLIYLVLGTNICNSS